MTKKSFRHLRKVLRRKKTPVGIEERVAVFSRMTRKFYLSAMRFCIYFAFRLWLRRIYNTELLPKKGPAIIVSNHLSYFDWGILSAIYGREHLVFIANKDILNRPLVGWLMWLNIPIFINPGNPGIGYLKEALRFLRAGRILVIYPEGTRSRSGKMLAPKTGFVKIAMRAEVPIVPVGMKGTYETLPPHKKVPRLKRFDIVVGKPLKLSHKTSVFSDLFVQSNGVWRLVVGGEEEMAFRIMEIIRKMTGQEWESDKRDVANV